MTSNSSSSPTARRTFLTAASAGLLLVKPETAFGTQANSAIELGIVGCGSRGLWIGNHFVEHTGARIVALADPFADRTRAAQGKFKTDGGRLYNGLNGYKELLNSKIDAVAIESPPYYHPEQISAAVSARKHLYVAKPLAVDVAGCQSILRDSERARNTLSFVVDFQTRAQPAFQEAAQRVRRGDIGAAVLAHVYYHAGRLNPKAIPGAPAAEMRLRNWVFDKALSGDIIVEQNVHVLDMANWFLGAHPAAAFGTGGRKARVDVGDCWDHFLVQYDYPGGVKADFSSAQFTKGYSDLCARVYGAKGTLDSHYNGFTKITGDTPWPGVEKDPTFNQGAINNVKAFVDSVRAGKPLNNVPESVDSTLTAILGRMAAYSGKRVTWDEMLRSGEKLDAKLVL